LDNNASADDCISSAGFALSATEYGMLDSYNDRCLLYQSVHFCTDLEMAKKITIAPMQKKNDSENLMPAQIRPHLIPFLFKEMEGSEANYMTKKTKTIKIYPFSSLGKFMYNLMSGHVKLGKNDHMVLYLTIEQKKFNVYYGYLYASIGKSYELVKLNENQVKELNNLLEDIFRISFVYYIDGYVEFSPFGNIRNGIDRFLDKYDLLELGFQTESMRQLYYREKEKGTKISRMCNQSSNRVFNYEFEQNFGFNPKTMSQHQP
jgi:hypothetical protein